MDFESREIDFSQTQAPIIIAEVGVNHNCDMALAKTLIDQAQVCGADVVKFQAFIAEEEISRYADKAEYQKETTGKEGGQLEMAKALELSHAQLREVKDYCHSIDMPFLCTAFDEPSLDFLVNELHVKAVKIASSEVTNIPFLQAIAKTGVGMILSTGASNLDEVEAAVAAIQAISNSELIVLHCVSNYPAQKNQLNLKAINTLQDTLKLPIGYSDHSSGTQAPIVAAALGAVAIEKHFTLDRTLEGPDHRASIEPDELRDIVKGTLLAYEMMGDGVKQHVPCESANRTLIRKSLVAARDLPRGTVLCSDDLKIKRPATGISPENFNYVQGMRLLQDIEQDQPLDWQFIEKDRLIEKEQQA